MRRVKRINRENHTTGLTKRSLRAGVFWLILLGTLLIVSVTVKLVRTVRNTKAFIFNRYAVAIYLPDLRETMFYLKQNDQAELVRVPSDMKITATRGFGEYQVNKIYDLGQLGGYGAPLLLETLVDSFNYPILGLVVANTKVDVNKTEFTKKQLIEIFKEGEWFINGKQVNGQKGVFIFKLKRFRQAVYSLEKYQQQALATDEIINREGLALEVVNLTDINGLAERFANKLEANGYRVVKTASDNSEEEYICRLTARPGYKKNYSYLWLLNYFNCEDGGILPADSRVDVRVELGRGYQKVLEEKW